MESSEQIEQLGKVPESLWRRIRAEPDRAPEHIALAAAERFGPAAEEWVRVAGGGHTPESLAKTAYRKHVRLARLEGAALGLGGAYTAAPDLMALIWIQSRMVFYIAAAYGYDPRHPMRPAELLALQDVYPTPAEAREALDGVGGRLAGALAKRALVGGRDQRLARQLAVFAGKRIARRYAGRLVPLIGSPIGAVQNAGATKDLGRRALAYYGGTQARP
jgi:uncharacterized protein (DUF697 family)